MYGHVLSLTRLRIFFALSLLFILLTPDTNAVEPIFRLERVNDPDGVEIISLQCPSGEWCIAYFDFVTYKTEGRVLKLTLKNFINKQQLFAKPLALTPTCESSYKSKWLVNLHGKKSQGYQCSFDEKIPVPIIQLEGFVQKIPTKPVSAAAKNIL